MVTLYIALLAATVPPVCSDQVTDWPEGLRILPETELKVSTPAPALYNEHQQGHERHTRRLQTINCAFGTSGEVSISSDCKMGTVTLLTDDMSISGVDTMPTMPSIDGQNERQLFYVIQRKLVLSHVHLKNADQCDASSCLHGGAIHLDGGELELRHVVISNGQAYFGGAIYVTGSNSKVHIEWSTLIGNTASRPNNHYHAYGGAIYVDRGQVELRHVVISNGAAMRSGALYATGSESQVVIHSSTFTGNTASKVSSRRFSSRRLRRFAEHMVFRAAVA